MKIESGPIDQEGFVYLTGAKTPAKQCEVLQSNGIKFTKRADNYPALTWEAYNRQMSKDGTLNRQASEGPRLEAI